MPGFLLLPRTRTYPDQIIIRIVRQRRVRARLTHLDRYVKRNWAGNFDLLLLILALIQPNDIVNFEFTRHENQPVPIEECFVGVRFADAQKVLDRMDLFDENLARALRHHGNLEISIADVHFLVEFHSDRSAILSGSATNAALVFGRIRIDHPIAADFLQGKCVFFSLLNFWLNWIFYFLLVVVRTLQIPEMHMSFRPMLHGVPSAAESPHGTISVSSESVQ